MAGGSRIWMASHDGLGVPGALPARNGRGEHMTGLLGDCLRKLDSRVGRFLTRPDAACEENPRVRFFLYVVLASIIIFCIFVLLDFGTISPFRTTLMVLAGTGQIVSLLALKYCRNPRNAFRISAFVLLVYFLFLMSLGGPHGTRILWMLIFPAYAFLLFGGREGLLWTVAGFCCSLYVLFDPNQVLSAFPYEDETKRRFLITYALLAIVVIVFESITYRSQEEIARKRTSQLEEAIRRLSSEIDERKHVEEALVASEQRFRTLSEASFEGIAIIDAGRFLDVNDQLALMLGYERPEMIGMPVVNCVSPEYREVVGAAIRSGEAGPYEPLAQRKDGSVFPVELQPRVTELDGRSLRITAVRDVSDRKRAEQEIREARDFAEAVLESLPGTFYVFDDQLRLTRWNRNFEKVSGYTADELPGKHVLEFIDEKDRETIGKKIDEVLVHGTTSIEANTIEKAGGRISYLFSAVWRALGKKSYLLGTGIDISDRKKAEDLVRKSAELLRLAFETAPDAIVMTTLDSGLFIDFNSSFSDMLGYSKDEVIGRSAFDLHIWADVRKREEMVKVLLETGFVRNLETKFRTKSGTIITGLMSASSLMWNEELHLLAVFKDITDLKKAEEERLKLERQVQHAQKLESLGVLAGGIAHDFNNILTSILGHADLALTRNSPVAPAQSNLKEIKKGALRAAGLANQMLAYSGKGKFELKAIDLSALVREMAQLLDVSISKKGLLVYDLVDDLPMFEGDVNQMRQVVMNLITNASESLGQENGVIRLSTASMLCDRGYLDQLNKELQSSYEDPLPEGVYVLLEVSDTGCGMDLETQGRVFDPFFTTKFSGRGLGMAAVRGIVRGHNGGVKIYSEVGKGSIFKIFFPAKEGAGTIRLEKAEDMDLNQLWKERVVLVVDDEATVRDIIKELLEEIGLSVLTAVDGKQGVEVFRENVDKISCVLLDLTMPGLDGTQVFREIRRIRPDAKVILTSGYNEQDATQRFPDMGLAGFIQKPYTMGKLTEKLNEIFRRS
jgi:two-component system, cell cycle sensor histidine kinase and response regulator CckA